MNDINWGGKVNATANLEFKATLGDGTAVTLQIPLSQGYYPVHVAAAFVSVWNPAVDIRYLAVAVENVVQFPNTPLGVFQANSRTFAGVPMNDNGTLLNNIPGFVGLKVRATEPA